MTQRVVITGMGAITPIGIGKTDYWNNLLKGISGVRKVEFSGVDMDQFATKIAAPVDNFDPFQHLPKDKMMRYCGRASIFALAATKLALDDARLPLGLEGNRFTLQGIDPFKAGVILGASAGNVEILQKNFERASSDHGLRRLSPHALPYYLISSVPANVAMKFNCRGISYVISTACSSAAQAIGDAFHRLRNGPEDIIIAGGADSGMSPLVFGGFAALRAMSTRNDEPEKASRPFDKDRDGFVMGEGAGVLVLEKLEHALARNAPIYAEMKGFGVTADAYHMTAPEPQGRPFVRAMELALEDAGMVPDEIDYINAHGTSTLLNDVTETRAFKAAFGKRAYRMPINSTKSMIGHLLGAAGGVELIATVLSITHGLLHPTLNLDSPDPECDLDYVPQTMRRVAIKTGMSTCLGFGGFNSVLIVSAMTAS